MLDLKLAVVLVAVLSVGMLLLGLRVGRAKSRWPGIAALVSVALFYGVYFLLLRDSVMLLKIVPVSSVSIMGDPAPWTTAFAAGVLLAQQRVAATRRWLIASLAIVMGWYGPVNVFARTAPPTAYEWHEGVCLQTAQSTCGPAAAATLLRHHGVETDETEMTRLCLTGVDGTHLTGLYRGLSLRTPRQMKPRAEQLQVDDLISRPDCLPAIVSLRLTREQAATDPRYTEEWGWQVGVMHSVVLLGFEEGNRVVIADPGAGRERWSIRGLEELWTGEVLYLEADD